MEKLNDEVEFETPSVTGTTDSPAIQISSRKAWQARAWSISSSSSEHSTADCESTRTCQELTWPRAKGSTMRTSFETPEARHSFCLSAFRPTSDVDLRSMLSDNSAASSFEDVQTRAVSICPKLHSMMEPGMAGLERTDKPLASLSLLPSAATEAVTGPKASRAYLQTNRDLTAPGSLEVSQIWASAPAHKLANPFEGLPNDAGFFGHQPW